MPDRPLGARPLCPITFCRTPLMAGQRTHDHSARYQEDAHAQERNDGNDLHHRQPGLDLTVLPGSQQVNSANYNDNNEGNNPLGHLREPADEKLRRARDLQARDHDEHDPIEPPDRKAGPPADPGLGVGREGTRRRQRRRQSASASMTDTTMTARPRRTRGPRDLLGNRGAGPQEETSTDRQAQGHHGQVPRLELLACRGASRRRGGGRRRRC